MISIADHLLPPCTVRITVRGQHSGTGFYVAPQMVATCAHVIESPSRPTTPIDAGEIRVIDRDGDSHAVEIRSIGMKPKTDLAVLKLRAATQHPCVLLDATQMLSRDALHTFAYPKDHLEGVPRPLVGAGATGNARLALGSGQVERGMSGAPLLNRRTGGVCGVVNRTRDEDSELGGYGVPISDLLALDKAVRAENESYHQRSNEWLSALDADQQSGWHAARARASASARAFAVTLDETGDGWRVTADDPRDADLDPVPVDLNTVKSKVARLFRDWASLHGRVDEDEQVLLLGRILFYAAFPGPIGDRLVELINAPEGERVLICLRFDPDLDPEFRELPWEHLCLPEPDDVYVATDHRLSFTRASGRAGDELPSARPGPLSVVLAAVSPAEPDEARTAIERVADGLRRVAAQPPGLDLDVLLDPDAGALSAKLTEDAPDVLHYAGFGRYRNGIDQIALGAWGGEPDFVSKEGLVDCLPEPRPRLVVLEQCSAPAGPVATDFSVLAPALLDEGVAAVLAFQYLVSPHHTGLFNEAFYGALMAGELVEFAVQAGRTRVRQYRRTFVSPTLFVRRPGELRLVLPGAGASIGDQRGGAFGGMVNA